MRRTLALCLLLLTAGLPFGAADAAVIRSWDDANQKGGDLFNSLSGFGYEPFENALLARQHIVLPGIAELTANNLLGVNVFFWGSSEHILSASEQTVLSDFINAGGLIILETDSDQAFPDEQAAANSAYVALGLAVIDPTVSGVASADQGTFANIVTSTTVGPLGDLRSLTWAGSPSPGVPGGGAVIGALGGSNKWVEYAVGSGGVLGVADPFGLSTFTRDTSSFYNPNNLNAYLNFIENAAPVPEPGSLMLVGSGLVGLAAWRRRKRVS